MTKKNIIIGAVVIIAILLGLSNIIFAKEVVNFPEKHTQLDERLRFKFDSWITANGNKDFCLPKASLLRDEMEARRALGDDITELEIRHNRVVHECTEVVESVLFQ